MRIRPNTLRMVLLVASCVFFLGQVALFCGFTVDDAFISFRYSDNFSRGAGLVFNAGERVEGYSNFLWVVLLGLAAAVGMDPVVVSKLLGLISLVSIVPCVWRIGTRISISATVRAGAVLLLSTNFGLCFFSITGMETGLFAAVLIWAAYFFLKNDGTVTTSVALLSFLATLTRPEGVLLFPSFLLFHAVRTRRLDGRAVRPTALFLALVGIFVAWRYAYYGALVPNTFYIKSKRFIEGVPSLSSVLYDVSTLVFSSGGVLVLLLFLFVLTRTDLRRRVYALFPVVVMMSLFQIYSGRDWMFGSRFLVPMLPAYFLVAAMGLWALVDKLRNASPARKETVYVLLILLIGISNLGETYHFYANRHRYPGFIMTSTDMVSAAKWIREHYPEDYAIVCWRIGALGYYSKLRLIDSLGLTDRYIARELFQARDISRSNERVKRYIAEKNPELFMGTGKPGVAPKEVIELYDRRYKFVKEFPQGSEETWLLYERTEQAA